MRRVWIADFALLGALLLAALIVGLFVGHTGWLVALALAGFLGYNLYQLDRLERWLGPGRRRNPPQSWGMWGEVFDHYFRLQKRYNKRKKRLARVIREFRESTAAMPDGSLVLDSDFRILWYNEAASRMLSLSGKRDLGQSILNLIRSPQFRDYLRSGKHDLPVNLNSPVDESRTLSARLIAYGHNQYLLLFRDVTRIQRLQAMRRDFVANASHELRSPLTVLSGYLETLADETPGGSEWHQPVEEMRAQCSRMASLVNDLLELSRLETEEHDAPTDEVVDVPGMVARIVRSAEAEDTDGHKIRAEVESAAGLAGVERELYSVFSNLVVNAIRYTPAGGRIEVRWFVDEAGEGVFEVKDTGIGIEPRHIPFITQRFYRVDSSNSRSKGGTGLGLAIVKHVLQRHDGRLEVESTLGEGSLFRCRFAGRRVVHDGLIVSAKPLPGG